MAVIPGPQWLKKNECPWRLQRGLQLYRCAVVSSGTHSAHISDSSPQVSWREDETGAFSIDADTTFRARTVRITPIDQCANRQCSNQAHEGRMTLVTVHTAATGASRDVTLLLCAPCSEYLARMFPQQ